MARSAYGSIRKLPSGKFQARVTGPDGRMVSAPQTYRTKGDANAWIAKARTEMSSGAWIDPRSGAESLATYAAGWMKQRTVRGRPLKPRTRQDYERHLRDHILPTFGKDKLSSITPARVRTWHSKMLDDHGTTAARQAYSLLRAVLNTALNDDLIARNPCRINGAGQPNTKARPHLSHDQVQALIAVMPERYRCLFTLMFWAALRIGEAVALQYRDYDTKTGTLSITHQHVELKGQLPVDGPVKWDSIRTVHLPDQARAILDAHIAANPGKAAECIFKRPDGSQLRQGHVQGSWGFHRVKVAGLETVKPHDLRHAGLTLATELGATMAETMRRAGHSTIRAAMIYQHAAESRDKDLAARMSAMGISGT